MVIDATRSACRPIDLYVKETIDFLAASAQAAPAHRVRDLITTWLGQPRPVVRPLIRRRGHTLSHDLAGSLGEPEFCSGIAHGRTSAQLSS